MERRSKYFLDELESIANIVPAAMAIPLLIAFQATGLVLVIALWLGLRTAALLISTSPPSQHLPNSAEALSERDRWARNLERQTLAASIASSEADESETLASAQADEHETLAPAQADEHETLAPAQADELDTVASAKADKFKAVVSARLSVPADEARSSRSNEDPAALVP